MTPKAAVSKLRIRKGEYMIASFENQLNSVVMRSCRLILILPQPFFLQQVCGAIFDDNETVYSHPRLFLTMLSTPEPGFLRRSFSL
jgi:hypothetical protein